MVWQCSDLRLCVAAFLTPGDIAATLVSGFHRGYYDRSDRKHVRVMYRHLCAMYRQTPPKTICRGITCWHAPTRAGGGDSALCVQRLQSLVYQWGFGNELAACIQRIGLLFPHPSPVAHSLNMRAFASLQTLVIHDREIRTSLSHCGGVEWPGRFPASAIWPLLRNLPHLAELVWFPPMTRAPVWGTERDLPDWAHVEEMRSRTGRAYTQFVLKEISGLPHLTVFQIASTDTVFSPRARSLDSADLRLLESLPTLQSLHIPLALVSSALCALGQLEALHITESQYQILEDWRDPVRALHSVTSWIPQLKTLCTSFEFAANFGVFSTQLQPENTHNPSLTLAHSRLESLCFDCDEMTITA